MKTERERERIRETTKLDVNIIKLASSSSLLFFLSCHSLCVTKPSFSEPINGFAVHWDTERKQD